jgi:dTMP kinase
MSSTEKGTYIVIEGTDGAGTTTQKDLLRSYFNIYGRATIDVAEPGGTPIGDALRRVVKDSRLDRSPESNLDLFNVCRRELANQVILPALYSGKNVVSDRNWFSTYAYQGFGEGIELDRIKNQARSTLGELFMPKFAVVIDVPVEVSEERIKCRGCNANDHFERKGRLFFENVREGYLSLAEEYSLPVIDGTNPINDVSRSILILMHNQGLLENAV